MEEGEFRRILDRVYGWLKLAEEDEDTWNLPAKFLAVVRTALDGDASREWFARWKEGKASERGDFGHMVE